MSTPNRDEEHDDQDQHGDRRQGGQVVPFPTQEVPPTSPGGEVERAPEVLDSELVSEEEYARRAGRDRSDRSPVLAVARVIRVVRDSEPAATMGRGAVRAGVSVAQGLGSWAQRCWDAATLGVYRRQIEAAEALGDQERLAEWTTRKEQATERRHQRLRELPMLVAGLARIAGGVLCALVVGVLLVGLLVQVSGAGSFGDVIDGVLGMIRWVFTAATVVWTVLLVAVPVLVVVAAWREGRRAGTPPGWLATAAEADADVTIDETTIAAALGALRIPQITAYLKRGLPLQYLTPARRDGRGTHAVLRLPAGVTAEKIARRRGELATGVHRLAKEVWPTTGAEAGILDLWIADKGALAQGAGPYPLLDDGAVDVFRGVPFGKTLRGEPIMAPVMERNTITGGMPGQGKSSAARVVMCGAALDPTAELRIWVPDENFDFEVFVRRCSRYVMGATNEKIAEILEHLRELHAEVQTRGELLVSPCSPWRAARSGLKMHQQHHQPHRHLFSD